MVTCKTINQGEKMSNKRVYSICGMCSVRCPIQVESENGEITFIQGNQNIPAMKGAVCPRGAAGKALIMDKERPQTPLIREGERGEGRWRAVSWDEALDYVATRLSAIKAKYGPDAIQTTGSSRGTGNETNYIMQKFARAVIGTNNVDCCARV